MRKYRDLSVKIKIPVMMGIAGFFVFMLVCVLLLMLLRTQSLNNSSRIAQLAAIEAGGRLSERVSGSAGVIRAFAGLVANMAETDKVPNENKREVVLKEMDRMVSSDKNLQNIWCTLEPNALDEMDTVFIHQTGSDILGIFSPWYSEGKAINSDRIDYDEDYYKIPKTTGRDYITEPYTDEVNGKKIQMFTVSIPVMLNGICIGVVGADFYVEDMYRLIASLNTGTVGKLVTDKGTVAVNHDFTRIGKEAEHGNREILDKLSEGEMFEGMYHFEGKEVYKVYVPIQLIEDNKPWFYAVDVPRDEIYAQSRQIARYLIIFCLVGVALIALAGGVIMQSIIKSIIKVTGIIRKLSLGHIDLHIDEDQNQDEIGKMKKELGQLVEGLKNTADFAGNIGKGKLDAEYHLLSNDDILGNSLLDMRESLQKAQNEQTIRAREEEQRNWGTSGLAKFSEILRRDNDNIETLSYNIVSSMVKYMDANQGGIFILNETENDEEKVLEMKACYAYDRKKFQKKQIHQGEGLVGTCYLEGKPIYMTDVPNEYINITSGLGKANPGAIFICPLKLNRKIYGVIELASFHEFEPYQIEFIQKLSESIAATISTVQVNIRTERLLAQTKLQTEEMANQEEELRQNMEEMQATQEEMYRHGADLQETLEKMQEVQSLMEAVGNNLPNGFIFRLVRYNNHPQRMCMEYVSAKWESITGLTSESVHENMSPFFTLVHPDDQQPLADAIEESVKTHTFYIEIRIKRDDAYRWLRMVSHPHSDDKRMMWDGIMTDITARKDSEKTFEGKVHWYEALLDAFEETPISVTDMNKKITFLNKAALTILGTTREATMGKYCGDVWNVDICKDERCGIECLKCNKGKSEFQVEDTIFTTLASYIKDSEGNNIGHIEVVDNITKIANKDFEMQQFYNTIFETNNVVEFASDAIITAVNQNFLNLWQTDRSTFVGKHLSAFIGEEAFTEIKTTVSKGKLFDEVLNMNVDGKQMRCNLTFVPINDRQGNLQRVLLLVTVEK